jgi:uncharacterized membrane protein YedE/YeeE
LDLTFLIDHLGDSGVSALMGLFLGLVYGTFAQRSRFCLRAAAIEFVRHQYGTRLAVWLFMFSGAVVGTQALISAGALDVSHTRMLADRGSMSGALIGGALFGCGMILTRGCVSRLFVLAGQGNLRSALFALVFAATAQASLAGILSPLREALTNLWTIEAGALNAASFLHIGARGTLAIALLWLAAALFFGVRSKVPPWGWLGGLGVGLAIMSGWYITYCLSQQLFDPQPVKSMTFSGPSARVFIFFLSSPGTIFDFDTGLIPGVFLGSFLAAAASRELKLEWFEGAPSMRRYLIGATFMGFGGMLAGGCSVGSVSGSAIFATTAWTALLAIWAGAALTDYFLDWPQIKIPARIRDLCES